MQPIRQASRQYQPSPGADHERTPRVAGFGFHLPREI
jgi:hypothetical protein